MKQPKPKYRYCWSCSRQLYGRRHRLVSVRGSGHVVSCHVSCADELVRDGDADVVEATVAA